MNEKMMELEMYANEFGMSLDEAAMDILFDFYEAAGFDGDILFKELTSKSSEELIQLFMEI